MDWFESEYGVPRKRRPQRPVGPQKSLFPDPPSPEPTPEDLEAEKVRLAREADEEARRQQRLKAHGMAVAEANEPGQIEHLRAVARHIAQVRGSVSMNDVRDYVAASEEVIHWGGWTGSLFKGSEWVFTGEREPARYEKSHGREVKVWKLGGE